MLSYVGPPCVTLAYDILALLIQSSYTFIVNEVIHKAMPLLIDTIWLHDPLFHHLKREIDHISYIFRRKCYREKIQDDRGVWKHSIHSIGI